MAESTLTKRESLWTVQEVADYLKVTRAYVYRLPLRYAKIGRGRRYDPADIRLYVQLHTTAA